MTQAQYDAILARLTALENQANDMAVAIGKFITLSQLNDLMVLLQADIAAFSIQITALEERITAIEEEPLS